MAKDVLSLTLKEYEKNNIDFPEPSDLESIPCDDNSFVKLALNDSKSSTTFLQS